MDGFAVNEFVKYVGAMIALLDPFTAVALMLTLTPGYTRPGAFASPSSPARRFWSH
jgi:hypothetical protein